MEYFLKTGVGPVLNKTIEITALHKNGNEFIINLSISSVQIDGEWLFIAFLSDISDRKKAEEQLIYKEAELLQARSLEQKKDEFISIASHELKTPLTMVKAYSQLALQLFSESDKPGFQYLTKIDQFCNKLNELIVNLLDVSRIHAGKLQLTRTPTELSSFITDTLNSIQHVVGSHQLILAENTRAFIDIDSLRMEQVLSNIINNAAKYSPGQSEIIINSTTKNNEVIVSCTDFGVGIPPENLDKIFDRFYRVNEEDQQFAGLGIGLFV